MRDKVRDKLSKKQYDHDFTMLRLDDLHVVVIDGAAHVGGATHGDCP